MHRVQLHTSPLPAKYLWCMLHLRISLHEPPEGSKECSRVLHPLLLLRKGMKLCVQCVHFSDVSHPRAHNCNCSLHLWFAIVLCNIWQRLLRTLYELIITAPSAPCIPSSWSFPHHLRQCVATIYGGPPAMCLWVLLCFLVLSTTTWSPSKSPFLLCVLLILVGCSVSRFSSSISSASSTSSPSSPSSARSLLDFILHANFGMMKDNQKKLY